MTQQTRDVVLFRDRKYYLADVSPLGFPLDPRNHGFTLYAASTANYRGFYCVYAVVEDWLELRRCAIYVSDEIHNETRLGRGPLLMGLPPAIPMRLAPQHHFLWWNWGEAWEEISHERGYIAYEDVAAPLSFTGGFLIGADLLGCSWVLPDASCYREVLELTFEQGILTMVADRSEAMHRHRLIRTEYFARFNSEMSEEERVKLLGELLNHYNGSLDHWYCQWRDPDGNPMG
jgi:hypothetical protein